MTSTPSQLPYADFLTRWGISCERTETSLRIIAPPIRSFGVLPQGLKLGIGFIGACTLMFILVRTSEGQVTTPGAIEQLCVYGMILAVLMYFAYRRMRESVLLEVGPESFSISRIAHARASTLRWWRRSRVARVEPNPDEGTLLVYLTDLPMVELRLALNPQVTEWIAIQISEALRTLPQGVPRVERLPSARLRHRWIVGRVLLLTLTILLVVAGMGMLVIDRVPWNGLGILSLLVAIFSGLAASRLTRNL